MMTDPIADMLTRIRNASLVGKKETYVPFSKIKMGIADILTSNGYLQSAAKKQIGKLAYILLTLKYNNGAPAIQHIKRISKPGRRHYVGKGGIKEVLNGFGISIISTPKGLLTNEEAVALNVGGELICEIY